VRRSDKDVKMRLAALHWSRALFRWDAFVLDTMTALAGASSVASSSFCSNATLWINALI
jgi:hypothetical protein